MTIDAHFLALDHAAALELLYGVDATITREKDVFLCITTADCVPLLLYDREKGVIAAIHAGWRGSVGGIVEKTVARMQQRFGSSPADLIAAIGPVINQSHYEVGDEVIRQFQNRGFDLSDTTLFLKKSADSKYHIDLKELNRRELIRLGVEEDKIEKSNLCTYERGDLFFSARRQTIHSGRMLTGIMMKG